MECPILIVTCQQVQEIVRPVRYQGVNNFFDLDVALLVLSKTVNTGDYIMPACMDWSATMKPKNDELGYVSTRYC